MLYQVSVQTIVDSDSVKEWQDHEFILAVIRKFHGLDVQPDDEDLIKKGVPKRETITVVKELF